MLDTPHQSAVPSVMLLDEWVALDPVAVLKHNRRLLDKTNLPAHAHHIILPIGSETIYCYLKARFGPPNGFAMQLKSPTSDNLIHWEYMLGIGDNVIRIAGITTRVEVNVWTNEEVDPQAFVSMFKGQFSKHGRMIGEERKKLERWRLFVNPYSRLNGMIKELEWQLSEVTPTPPPRPFLNCPGDRERTREYLCELRRYVAAVNRVVGTGLCIRLIVPIWVEAFVNMLIFVLAKPTIKNDSRMYDNFLRQQIDLRVKMMAQYCEGFEHEIDGSSQEFRDMHTLFNQRNDLLHGNVDPQRFMVDEVFFDANIPLYKDDRSEIERAMSAATRFIEPEAARADIIAGSAFIIYLMNQIERPLRDQLWGVLDTPLPGYRPDNKRVGLLFPPFAVDMFCGSGGSS